MPSLSSLFIARAFSERGFGTGAVSSRMSGTGPGEGKHLGDWGIWNVALVVRSNSSTQRRGRTHLRQVWANLDGVEVAPFGSFASGVHSIGSDIDISLEVSPDSKWAYSPTNAESQPTPPGLRGKQGAKSLRKLRDAEAAERKKAKVRAEYHHPIRQHSPTQTHRDARSEVVSGRVLGYSAAE